MTDTMLKVLAADGSACKGGSGVWALPTEHGPGDWMPVIDNPRACTRGYHLCRPKDVLTWLPADTIYEAEIHPAAIIHEAGDKVVVSQARLVRRLDWSERIGWDFVIDVAHKVPTIPADLLTKCSERRDASGDSLPHPEFVRKLPAFVDSMAAEMDKEWLHNPSRAVQVLSEMVGVTSERGWIMSRLAALLLGRREQDAS